MSGDLMLAQLEEQLNLGRSLMKSGLLPSSIKSPEAVVAIMMVGRELGLPPMTALRTIHIVEGRPTLSADLMVSLVLRSGIAEYWKCAELTDKVCTMETKRSGQVTSYTFTMEDAQKANLAGRQNYKAHPKAMLRARASATLARMVYPDVLLGVYAPEEFVQEPHEEYVDVAPVSVPAPRALESEAPTGNPLLLSSSDDKAGEIAHARKRIAECENMEQLNALVPVMKGMPAWLRDEVREQFMEKRRELDVPKVTVESADEMHEIAIRAVQNLLKQGAHKDSIIAQITAEFRDKRLPAETYQACMQLLM